MPWNNQLLLGEGKRGNTGRARASALVLPKKRISLPRWEGIKGMGRCSLINTTKEIMHYTNHNYSGLFGGESVNDIPGLMRKVLCVANVCHVPVCTKLISNRVLSASMVLK